ncbi:ejaculatory bulb-specific protein 3-like [Anoplolepis gracilipes]|uniref:ejaculatory bulb-specific protein 3-like n=1 Tax=Anoplolepis gracilipes TaxID=354296 RepID=UPI003B9E6B70
MARLICTIGIIFIALICVLAQEEKYDDKYDFIEFKKILANDKLRDQYYNCFMEIGPCATADAKFFKSIVSEAFQTQCKKCTEQQKLMLDAISDYYVTNESEKWNRFIAKSLEDMKKKAQG